MIYKKCKGCEKDNILIFSWITGDNFCKECRKDLWNVGLRLKEKKDLIGNDIKSDFVQYKNLNSESGRKNGINWDNSKNIIIVFGVIIIIMLIIAFRSSNQESDYDKAMRNSMLKNYKNETIDCTGINKNSPTCKYLENLPVNESGSSQVYP
jgi:hypothetical protein